MQLVWGFAVALILQTQNTIIVQFASFDKVIQFISTRGDCPCNVYLSPWEVSDISLLVSFALLGTNVTSDPFNNGGKESYLF